MRAVLDDTLVSLQIAADVVERFDHVDIEVIHSAALPQRVRAGTGLTERAVSRGSRLAGERKN